MHASLPLSLVPVEGQFSKMLDKYLGEVNTLVVVILKVCIDNSNKKVSSCISCVLVFGGWVMALVAMVMTSAYISKAVLISMRAVMCSSTYVSAYKIMSCTFNRLTP